MNLAQALSILRPGAEWAECNGIITWLDTVQTQPTNAEIQTIMDTYVPPLTLEQRIAKLEAK